ncbi:zinc finger protein 474-like isoform X1 [Homalodisca vitripennis]|uniref:zinc finger protein 474-like isoform X1 n=1 Tax=Homalodisca vitripennis TaxID=197043 RepID=UPI001EEAD3AC|nr:zinc finger protein 474-like isoform X1 [Homalodisca vitripennis]
MSVKVQVAPSPHLWSVVKKMHLKTGKVASGRHRPDTATLEKPLILDPGLLRKVDMTRLTRDRLLTIENLINTPKKTKTSPKPKEKPGKSSIRSKSREDNTESWVDEEISSISDFKRKNSRVINTTFRVRSHVRKGLREVFSSPTQLQISPAPEKQPVKSKSPKVKETQTNRDKKSVEDVFGTLIVSETLVPSPCNTCGRSERPERLHAHPSMPQNKRSKLKDDQENTAVMQQKNSVTKPMAMKFRSGKSRGEKHPDVERPQEQIKSPVQKDTKEEQKKTVPLIRRETFKIERGPKPVIAVEKKMSQPSPSPTRKLAVPPNPPPRRQALPRTPEKETPREDPPATPSEMSNPPVVHSGSPRRPRTITCYLCQKQFGTASYPLHEPQCLQKWQRENQMLAVPQPEPSKPPSRRPSEDGVLDHAWEVAQATMVSCDRCSKTFLPHRLEAHQRVCGPQIVSTAVKPSIPKQVQEWDSDRDDRSERSVLLEGPTSIHCHICGRIFNKNAIDQHEQQCLKRWQQEHSRDSSSSCPASTTSSPPGSHPSTPRRRLVLCYLCGRQFGSASIAIHEPQCLRRWRQENERLPPTQRRAEPVKPDVIYDSETGQVDYAATDDAQWQCHLVQLVPCARCGRTFNPDRVSVHEKCCKGPSKH